MILVSGDSPFRALSPGPSPVPGEGSAVKHVFKGLEGHKYPLKMLVSNARIMRKEPTEAEKKLWGVLRRRQLEGLYFRRQRPIGIFVLDFYCEEKNLAVEVDGEIHLDSEQNKYDQIRTEFLTERGVRVLRFQNKEVMENLGWVLSEIKKQISS